VGISVATFINEVLPKRLKGVVRFVIEILATVPSVVYGLWGIFVLVPALRTTAFPLLRKALGFLPFFQGPIYGPSMLAAGIILAIMVMPYVM